jgi:hypothetical protein
MEASRTSETSVDIQLRTWQYIPEDSDPQMNSKFIWPYNDNKRHSPYISMELKFVPNMTTIR